MIVRKILLAAGAAALMSTPAWALASQTPSSQGTDNAPSTTPVGPPTTTPNNTDNPGSARRNPGHDHSGNNDKSHGDKGRGLSHRCRPHSVAYVASGKFVSQTLTKNADGSYSGGLVVEVTRTNHHAAGDKGQTVTYTLTNARVGLRLSDVNNDGSVGLDDLAAGDRVHVIGRVTVLAKRCPTGEFTATKTVRFVVIHGPATVGGDKS